MKVTARTKEALAFRREEKDLLARGYRRHETDWEIHRGGKYDQRILDAKISCDGLYVYTKIGVPPKPRRHRMPEGECAYCDAERAKNNEHHPSHDASSRCESGKHEHCTCDCCW